MRARIAHYGAAAKAPNTARSYDAQMRQFRSWCETHGLSARLPVPAAVVAGWLCDLADRGFARASIEVALAAMRAHHRDAGLPYENGSLLVTAIRGIRRTVIAPARQVAPLKGALLLALLSRKPSSNRDIRDAAVVAALYLFALRRSELSGLDFCHLGQGRGVLLPTISAFELTIASSKASAAVAKKSVAVRADNPLATAAIDRWIECARLLGGTPFIRQILPGGGIGERLSDGGVARAVKATVFRSLIETGVPYAQAFTTAATFSGHSGRIGFVQTAKEAGAQDSAIATATRHAGPQMIGRYGARADQILTAPHRLPGVGI